MSIFLHFTHKHRDIISPRNMQVNALYRYESSVFRWITYYQTFFFVRVTKQSNKNGRNKTATTYQTVEFFNQISWMLLKTALATFDSLFLLLIFNFLYLEQNFLNLHFGVFSFQFPICGIPNLFINNSYMKTLSKPQVSRLSILTL